MNIFAEHPELGESVKKIIDADLIIKQRCCTNHDNNCQTNNLIDSIIVYYKLYCLCEQPDIVYDSQRKHKFCFYSADNFVLNIWFDFYETNVRFTISAATFNKYIHIEYGYDDMVYFYDKFYIYEINDDIYHKIKTESYRGTTNNLYYADNIIFDNEVVRMITKYNNGLKIRNTFAGLTLKKILFDMTKNAAKLRD